MKYLLLTCIFLISYQTYSQQAIIDTLTNEKVIKLSKLGLDASIIITKIQTSHPDFSIGADALIALSENEVNAEVIQEMIRVQNEVDVALANKKDMSDPNVMHPAGIYYYNPMDDDPLRQVDATIMSNLKAGGFGTALAQRYTGGIASNKLKSNLGGAESRLQIYDPNPVFYFYFDNGGQADYSNWLFVVANTPNEFALIEFKVKGNSREAVIGTANAFGSTSGVNDKVKMDFQYDKITEGIYKVYFEEPLDQGEYCFMYASSTPSRYDNDKVFDFGIALD